MPGFGVRDTVKGMVPGHICIVQVKVCFAKVWLTQDCLVENRLVEVRCHQDA